MTSYNLTSLNNEEQRAVISIATWVSKERELGQARALLVKCRGLVSSVLLGEWWCRVCQKVSNRTRDLRGVSARLPRDILSWPLLNQDSPRRRSILHDLLLCAGGVALMGSQRGAGYHTITGLVCPHKIKTLLSLLNPNHYAWAPAPVTYDNLESPCKIYTVFDNCPLSGFLHGTSLMGSK